MPYLPPGDLAETLRWLFWLWLAGMALQPLAGRLFPDHADRGYAAGKMLGWLWAAYLPWLAPSLGVTLFAGSGAVVGVLALALAYIVFRDPGGSPGWRTIAVTEAGFAALFVLGLAARLANPDLTGLEKFMDLGFLNVAARSDAMPPADMWMAGKTINYYYYGHAGAALWSLLADAPGGHAYQLHMTALFALTGLLAFRLTQELARPAGARMAAVAGGTATVLVLYAGNLHGVLYSIFRPWMGSNHPDYYYPDSTRFIGFVPDVPDKAFTEFVAYGFKVGDMHAHLLATPVALFGVLMLLSVLRTNWPALRLRWSHTLVFGWLLGLAYMTNAWDVAVIGLLAAIVALVICARHMGHADRVLDRIGAAALAMLAAGFATAAPFVAGFETFADGISPAPAQTPAWQLLVVYGFGLPALAAVPFLGRVVPRAHRPGPAFVAVLALGILCFIAIPELVYVDDIYGADYARANTMFKFSFRAQMLLQIVAVAVIAHLAARSLAGLSLAMVLAVPLLATLVYAQHTFQPPSRIRGLDGLRFLGAERPAAEFLALLPLAGREALLEATGNSFDDTARMSAVTGLPAVIGWQGHQPLWRNQDPEVARRAALVDTAFRTGRPQDICRLVLAYDVRYVALGQVERDRYPELDETPSPRSGGLSTTTRRCGSSRWRRTPARHETGNYPSCQMRHQPCRAVAGLSAGQRRDGFRRPAAPGSALASWHGGVAGRHGGGPGAALVAAVPDNHPGTRRHVPLVHDPDNLGRPGHGADRPWPGLFRRGPCRGA